MLPGDQPGQTHAQTCLLDHITELQARLSALTGQTVTIQITEDTLEHADRAWSAQDKPTA